MVFEAKDLINQAIKRHKGSICVACSFGKDSLAVLHMALKTEPKIPVLFENSGVEFRETIELKNRLKKEWHLNLYETKPLKSFFQCVEEYGLPSLRKQGGKGGNSPRCCHYLKEEPGLRMMRSLKINAVMTGLQSCESRARSLLAKRYDNSHAPIMSSEYEGEIVQFCAQRWLTKKTLIWSYHPIMHWSTQEVWDYINKNDLPINEVYLKWGRIYPRCGCLPCTAYASWKERLSISHPKLFYHLMALKKKGGDSHD